MTALIIDYGLCNLGSVKRAVEECGGNCFITDDPGDLKDAERIILPGVGSFKDASDNLLKSGWPDALQKAVLKENIPILGICLGMQLLCTVSTEGGESKGLNLIPGHVIKIDNQGTCFRVPHVGWNEISILKETPLLDKVQTGTDFYFVHSYHVIPDNKDLILAKVNYGADYSAVIGKGNIWGTQFHPEKSSRSGFQIIKNFLNYYA